MSYRWPCTCCAERHPVPGNACWEKPAVGRWSEGQGWQRTGTRWWRTAQQSILYHWRSGSPSGPAACQQQSVSYYPWHDSICTENLWKLFFLWRLWYFTGRLYHEISCANWDNLVLEVSEWGLWVPIWPTKLRHLCTHGTPIHIFHTQYINR